MKILTKLKQNQSGLGHVLVAAVAVVSLAAVGFVGLRLQKQSNAASTPSVSSISNICGSGYSQYIDYPIKQKGTSTKIATMYLFFQKQKNVCAILYSNGKANGVKKPMEVHLSTFSNCGGFSFHDLSYKKSIPYYKSSESSKDTGNYATYAGPVKRKTAHCIAATGYMKYKNVSYQMDVGTNN